MVGVLWHFAIRAVVSCNQGCSICNTAFTRISTAALINFSRLKCGAYSRAVLFRVNTVIVRLRNLKEKHTSEKSAKMLKKHGALRRSKIITECCNFDYKIIA